MKRLFPLILFFIAVFGFFGCTYRANKKQSANTPKENDQEVAVNIVDINTGSTTKGSLSMSKWETYTYQLDSVVFSSNRNAAKEFKQHETKLYFVKTWNTPDYYVFNGEFTSCLWDANVFFGYEKDGYIHYLTKYEGYSDRYKNETGDSAIVIESKFPKSGTSEDPRTTCIWIKSIRELKEYKTLDEFLSALIGDEKEFLFYKTKIRQNILSSKGSAWQDKIVSYTSQTVKGDPKTWDAWKWPGYYKKESGN